MSILRTSPMYFLDREHLFLVLIFPYLLCAMPSLADKTFPLRIKVAAGLLAGIGFCLKPHCLVVLAGIMFMDLLMRRTWRGLVRLENLIICALGLFYLLSVLLATPEYFSTVMPIAMATYSSTRDESPILFYALNAVFTLLPLMLLFRPRYHSPYRSDIYYLAGLLPFFFFYALLNNNWAYTYYPLTSMALFLAGFMLWEFMYLAKTFHSRAFPTWRLWLAQGIGVACFVFLQDIFQHYIYELVFLFALFAFWEWSYLRRNDRERSLPQWTFWAGAYVCILSFSLKALISFNYFLSVFEDGCTNNARCYHDDVFVAEVQGRQGPLTFGSLSVEFARWTRLSLYSGAKWETRFPQLWMLPKFLASDAAFAREHQWILDYVAESLAQDMDIRKPEVMFVDDTNIVYGKYAPIDMVPYFSFNAHFREAWRHYRFLHRIDLCAVPGNPHPKYKQVCSYDVYRRTE